MKGLTICKRTTKTEGRIKLRFRLRIGRDVDLYHKSEIEAELRDLEKFKDSGELKTKVSIYNEKLKFRIDSEIDAIETAFINLCEKKDKSRITAEEFETEINSLLHPEKLVIEPDQPTMLSRYARFIEDGVLDGIFGVRRESHYQVCLRELTRFLTITHRTDILPSEFDADDLISFRQFLLDEYLYVEKHPSLYEQMHRNNIPAKRRDPNTVATKLKKLQAFFNDLTEIGEISTSPFAHLGKKKKRNFMRESYDQPVFLMQEEFLKVMETQVPESLRETKDVFMLQCAFGCRVGDYMNLTMSNVGVTPQGIPYIHYLPEKTLRENIGRKEIETPIMLYALEIIKRTRFKFNILHYVGGKSGYNKKIKELLEFCEIDRMCPVFDDIKGVNTYHPVYELASSKICRKTHVDILTKAQVNLYAAGLHETGSSAVNHYTYMGIEDRFKLMCYAYRQPFYTADKELNITIPSQKAR